ncbi:hypothetical protein QTP88_013954 [Uroleucon formosanum]
MGQIKLVTSDIRSIVQYDYEVSLTPVLAACDFLTENRRNLALGIIGLIRKANNHGVVDVPVTGFFPYPSIYLSLSVFLSDFGRVGSAAEKRLTADDGQAASAGYKGWGEARRAGPAGAYSQTEARTRIYSAPASVVVAFPLLSQQLVGGEW